MKKLQTKWDIFNEYMVLYLFWGWKTTDEMGHFQRILGFIFILRGTMEWFKQNFLSLFSTFASSLTIYLVYQSLFNRDVQGIRKRRGARFWERVQQSQQGRIIDPIRCDVRPLFFSIFAVGMSWYMLHYKFISFHKFKPLLFHT